MSHTISNYVSMIIFQMCIYAKTPKPFFEFIFFSYLLIYNYFFLSLYKNNSISFGYQAINKIFVIVYITIDLYGRIILSINGYIFQLNFLYISVKIAGPNIV